MTTNTESVLSILAGRTIASAAMERYGIVALTAADGLIFKIIPSLITTDRPKVRIVCMNCRLRYLEFSDGGDIPPIYCEGCGEGWDTIEQHMALAAASVIRGE